MLWYLHTPVVRWYGTNSTYPDTYWNPVVAALPGLHRPRGLVHLHFRWSGDNEGDRRVTPMTSTRPYQVLPTRSVPGTVLPYRYGTRSRRLGDESPPSDTCEPSTPPASSEFGDTHDLPSPPHTSAPLIKPSPNTEFPTPSAIKIVFVV